MRTMANGQLRATPTRLHPNRKPNPIRNPSIVSTICSLISFVVSRRRVSGNWPALRTDGSLTKNYSTAQHTRSKSEPKQNLSAIV
ncbi:hypothetical protein M5D96_000237 [Drosophila gunungcola]|uniref:Uncharacterized protein n=1 Tax=Drosophila gunungcola TaxID=103775 RepID=A0A9Q0BTF9_9MUSC|nr:hypothetical protein M5D96_000237 [Drosophila gunungcola]